ADVNVARGPSVRSDIELAALEARRTYWRRLSWLACVFAIACTIAFSAVLAAFLLSDGASRLLRRGFALPESMFSGAAGEGRTHGAGALAPAANPAGTARAAASGAAASTP